MVWLVSRLWDPLSLLPLHRDYRYKLPCLTFHLGDEQNNSGPHAYAAGTFLTEVSPYLYLGTF